MLSWKSASPAKTLSSKRESAPPENNGTYLLGGSAELVAPQLKESTMRHYDGNIRLGASNFFS